MTIYILIITIIVSIIAFQNSELMGKLIFNPYNVKNHNEWYRFITSGFIHADFIHLAVNMFVLYSFGQVVEMYYDITFGNKGWYYFLFLYIGGLLISILPTYAKHKDNPGYNGLGASGAVSAVLFASIIFGPLEKICLYGILCLPSIIMGTLYLFYSYYMDKKGGDNVNHDAHFWGAIYGVIYTLLLEPSLIIDFFQQIIHFRL
jgi:membrane associated rhomboid family serine protease